MKPIIKWAGGKTQLLNEINNILSNINNKETITTYIEPFVGGCSTMFNAIEQFPNIEHIYVNDLNEHLINLYIIVKEKPNELLICLDKLQSEFNDLKTTEQKQLYYLNIREQYNKQNNIYNNILHAAYFIFLNKTCFNGLYRENKKGEFNVPWNKNIKAINIYNKEDILNMSNIFNKYNVQFYNESYDTFLIKMFNKFYDSDTAEYHTPDDSVFVYFDPPYRPLIKSNKSIENMKCTIYNKDNFNDTDQINLSKLYTLYSDYGSYCMLSNSDPHNVDMSDNFFDNLYKYYNIKRILARRNINSNGNKRGKINELLITNF